MTRENSSLLSRRNLLAGLGFGVAAAGALATPALQLSWTRKPEAKGDWWDRQVTSLSRAGMDEWSRHLGAEFALAGGAVAKLAEVRPLASSRTAPGRTSGPGLRARLRSRRRHASGRRPYPGRQPCRAGALKIYFSACSDTCGGRRLQAIFN
jgi:hypothetical protein